MSNLNDNLLIDDDLISEELLEELDTDYQLDAYDDIGTLLDDEPLLEEEALKITDTVSGDDPTSEINELKAEHSMGEGKPAEPKDTYLRDSDDDFFVGADDSAVAEAEQHEYRIKSPANGRKVFKIVAVLPTVMVYEQGYLLYLVHPKLKDVRQVSAFSDRMAPVLWVDEYGNEGLWLVKEKHSYVLKSNINQPVRASWAEGGFIFQNRPSVEILTGHVDINPSSILGRYFPEERRLVDLNHPVVKDALGN